jgi:hypothetical protein
VIAETTKYVAEQRELEADACVEPDRIMRSLTPHPAAEFSFTARRLPE